MANEGPSLTKATYDKKRPRRDGPPSPGQLAREQEDKARDAANSRRFLKRLHEVGAHALFPDIPPKETIRRR